MRRGLALLIGALMVLGCTMQINLPDRRTAELARQYRTSFREAQTDLDAIEANRKRREAGGASYQATYLRRKVESEAAYDAAYIEASRLKSEIDSRPHVAPFYHWGGTHLSDAVCDTAELPELLDGPAP